MKAITLMIQLAILVAFLGASPLLASVNPELMADSISIPQAAFDVEMTHVSEDNFYQWDYKVHVPPEDISVIEFYMSHYSELSGWSKCKGDEYGRWSNHYVLKKPSKVVSIDDAAVIRRYSRILYSKTKSSLLSIELYYDEKRVENSSETFPVTGNVQHVRINLYPSLTIHSKKFLAHLGCTY